MGTDTIGSQRLGLRCLVLNGMNTFLRLWFNKRISGKFSRSLGYFGKQFGCPVHELCQISNPSGTQTLKSICPVLWELGLHTEYIVSPFPSLRFREAFQKRLWALKCESLHFPHCIKWPSFNVCVRYFVWNFTGNLWNSTQNILPKHWKIWFL